MIGGAAAISFAEAPESEQSSWRAAMARECRRYGLDAGRVAAAVSGDNPLSGGSAGRRWWEYLVGAAALGIFVWLACEAARPHIPFDLLGGRADARHGPVHRRCGVVLYRRTRFS